MANNSGRIIDRYKSNITSSQRKKLQGMYKGYRQTTADELREQYLDNRRSMGRTGAVASAYGLGQGYINRKQADIDRQTDRYAFQLGQQADSAFEKEVVNQANQTIDARNKAAQEAYKRKVAAAKKRQAAAQKKYENDLAAYEKALKEWKYANSLDKKKRAKYDKTLSRVPTVGRNYYYDPKTGKYYRTPAANPPKYTAIVKPSQMGNVGLWQYTDTATGGKPKPKTGQYGSVPKPSQQGKPKGGTVQQYTDAHTGSNILGKPTAPKYSVTDEVANILPPEMQSNIQAKVKEIEAMKPAEAEQFKAKATSDYVTAAANYEKATARLNQLMQTQVQAQDHLRQFKELEAKANDPRYSPEQRRGFTQQMSGLQRLYANEIGAWKASQNEISGLQRAIQPQFENLQYQRGLLGKLGVKMDDDEAAFNVNWVRNGNNWVSESSLFKKAATDIEDEDGELAKHLRRIDSAKENQRWGMTGWYIPQEEKEWFEANGYGFINDTPELREINLNGNNRINFSAQVYDYLKGIDRQSSDYQRQRNSQVALAKFQRLSDEDKVGAIARGEEITGLTKGLGYGRSLANSQTSVGDVLASVVGRDRSSVFVSSLLKKLDLPAGYLTKNTYGVMTDEDVLFIDYLFGIGEDQTAKDYLYILTEWGNSIAGQKRAEAISGENAPDWVKTVRESLWQIGYGGVGIVPNMKDQFSSGARPTSEAEAAAAAITQGKVERGWSPFWAQTVDSALQSAGNNAASLLLGQAIGSVGSAVGGTIGGTAGNVIGKIASHAPGAIMGASAAGQAKMEALRQGYGNKAATMYGLLNGVSEAVLQEQIGGLVGFGDRGVFTKALAGAVNKVSSPALRTLINQGLDILSEIGQEEFGNIFENINRSITLGEKRGLFDDFAEQAGETAVSTAISTFLLNALHIPAQLRNERGYSTIAKASGMSLKDAKFLLETQDDITSGKSVDPKDLSRYNELTAVLTAAMPENVAKAIADGKMTVADWVTSAEGVTQGKLMGKLSASERTAVQTEAVDHTEKLKGKTDEQRRDYLLAAAPTGKVGSAYYTTVDGKPINLRNLNTTQKANYVLAQKCAKAFEGSVDIVIHDTLPVSNGAMVGSDGRLHIALDTTNEQGRESIAYWTLAHEAGHALKIADSKAWDEMFGILTDYAKNYKDRDGKSLYDALVDSITNQYKYDSNSDAFNDEMFSLIAERMVGSEGEQWAATLGDSTIFDAIANDRNASAKAKKGFLGKMKNAVGKLSRQFRDGGFSKERKRLAKIREQLTEAYKRINEAPSIRDAAVARQVERKAHEEARKLREQIERREGFREGLKAHDAEFNKQKEAREKKARDDALLEEILKGFEEEDRIKASEMASNMSEGGEVVGDLEIDNDGNVNRFSIRTTPQTEEGWDSLVNDMVAAGYTEEQAKAWIDDMRSVAAEIMDAQEFLDYENDPRSSWFRKNAEYTQGTIDFSNNCPRRAEFTAQFDALMKQFPNFAFTAEDYETIRTIIKDAGIAVTCGGCYVEERRQHLSEIGQLFLDKYHAALNGETGDNALAKKFFDKISEEDKKYDITLDDIVSSDSLRKLYDEHPTLYKAFNNFNNARGMAAARLVYGLSEYNNQIKKWNKGTITRKNNLGGLRIFSYSDADPRIILDVMQIITDSASKGLMMQGYTKKPWFAVFMKDTGARLLRSHIPMGTGYKMVKGQMVLDFDNFEGINTKDKYYSMLDRDTDLNIGNNVIGINDTQIRLAMVSDIIDQIIPFHTGLKKSILHQKKLEGWSNYRDYQTDKAWTAGDNGEYKWRTVKKGGINLYTDIINAIDWSKTETHADGSPTTDAERFVNKYLDICREKGFKPRFAQFLCDENGNELSDYGDDHFYIEQDGKKVANPDAWYTYNPGYEKFLVDFRLFDKNGKIIEQNAVAPNFDNEFVKSLFSEYIKENPQAKPMDKGVQTKIVDAMKEKYGDELNSTRHSLRATDAEYLSLAEKYKDGTATEDDRYELATQVYEAAEQAMPNSKVRSKRDGSLRKVYHYTNRQFWEFKPSERSMGSSRTHGTGYYLSTSETEYSNFGNRKLVMYADIQNPFEMSLSAEQAQVIYDKYFRPHHEDRYHTYEPHVVQALQSSYKVFNYLKEAAETNNTTTDAILAELGYDGIHDGGLWVAFDSSQLKLADPVTYDDNGNIIPLSERFNEGNEDIRYQIRKASDLYHAEHDFSEPITTDEFRKLIAEENDTKRYFPKGLPKDFLKTISRKSLFTAPKLYRGIDAAEFDYLVDNGYLKSNGSYNFANQQGQTLADEDASYALSYATGFAPKPIADKHYRGDMLPTYLIEFINSPDLRMTKNQTQESYTEGKIDQKYITRVFEINYDPNTKKDMIHDITGDASTRSMLPNMGEGLSGYAHGEPVFFRDPNTGTILYAVQDEYGKESGRYVSEKMPDVTFSIGDTAAFNEAGMEQYFGVSVADDTELERMKVDEDGNLVPASYSPRYQQRDFRIDFNVPQLDTKALHEAVKGGEGTVENRFEVKYEKTDSGFAVHITDKDSGKTYDRAETVTEGNAKAEAERAAAAVIRNIKRGRADSTSRSTAGIYIEPGANAARSSAVPVSYEDENGNIRRNSKVARTMIEAGWMTDEQAERFADQVHDGIMSYEPVTNAEAKAYAEEKVSEHPAAAQAEWEAMYNSFAIPSDKDLAVGYQLMANAANDGDFDVMLKLGTELREMMTKAGQAIQSMNLLKQMGAVADVYRIDQAVQKMNDDLMKAAKGYFITVNPDLVEALLKTKPDTKEYDKALEALYKDIASQIKPSLSDALTEYRYLAMLGNPRTHIRNLVGNAVFMPAVAMKNVFGTILEGIRYGGNSAMKTKALAYGKQYGQFAKEDWGKVKTTIKSTGNKYRDMMSDIDNYRNHFGKGLVWLDKLAKFNSKLLEGEDMLFKQAYYRTALAAELSAKKVDLNDLRAAIEARDSGAKMQKDSAEFKLLSLYEEARARAIKEANVNTYNDANKFARDLNALSRGGGKLRHMMIEGLLPFKITPANIVSRSIEYSPVGLINSVTREAVKLHKGQIGANEFFDKIARGMSGSAIFALGVWLAKAGVLVGPLGDDKEDKEKKRRGHQAFSVEIAGNSYTLDWMAPVCIPLFTGVALYEMLEKDGNGEHWSQYAMNAMTGMLEPITKMSMLEGIENLIDSLAYSDSKLEDAAITVGTSYLTQFIPTFWGQIARTADEYTRRTYSDKESMLPRLVDKFVQTVQKKIPGWNQSLQPYVNELGEAEKEDNLLWRIFDNFISPGFRSAISNTKLDKELGRLGDPSIYPSTASRSFSYDGKTYNLHADEYTAYATARGTTYAALANALIDSKMYQALPDNKQVRSHALVADYANTMAKIVALNMRGITDVEWSKLDSWVNKANEYAKVSGSSTALADYIAIKAYTDGMKAEGGTVFGNIADYTVTNKDGTTSVKWNDMKYDYLKSLNLSDKERLFLADAFGIKDGAYEKAEAAVEEVPNLTVDSYTKALDFWQDLTLEKAQKKSSLSDEEYEKWLAGNTNAFKKYLNDAKDLTGQQKFALLTKIGSSEGWEGKANKLRSDYGVSYDDAWKAAYKASTLTSTDEESKNVQYMSYLNTTHLNGKQKFGLYGSFGSSTSSTLEKATAFVTGGTYNKGKDSAAKYGKPSYDALWNAYTAYNGGVQHEAFYDWLSKQSGMNAQQRFACCEFTNSTSAWMERALEANSKMGISFDVLWKIKVYWRNESGQGKKARITAYCKKLGLRQSQVDKLYALKFLS